ncbi:MAG: DUF4923 family protein [Prevotellaceae bacterium]|nr:DUF4923 family protein [Prevotellaceae bacterium]
MKKILILLLLALGTQSLPAQGLLDKVKQAVGASGSQTGQTVGSAVGVLSDLLGANTLTEKSICGTWTYSGSSIAFESENLLKKAASSVASSKLEQKLDSYLAMVGLKPGACTFTFNANKTYTAVIGKTKLNGTYTLDTKTKTLTLNFTSKSVGKVTARITGSSGKMSLLFKADKLLAMLTAATKMTGSTTLGTVSKLLGSYDGMMLGLEFKK